MTKYQMYAAENTLQEKMDVSHFVKKLIFWVLFSIIIYSLSFSLMNKVKIY